MKNYANICEEFGLYAEGLKKLHFMIIQYIIYFCTDLLRN